MLRDLRLGRKCENTSYSVTSALLGASTAVAVALAVAHAGSHEVTCEGRVGCAPLNALIVT